MFSLFSVVLLEVFPGFFDDSLGFVFISATYAFLLQLLIARGSERSHVNRGFTCIVFAFTLVSVVLLNY